MCQDRKLERTENGIGKLCSEKVKNFFNMKKVTTFSQNFLNACS